MAALPDFIKKIIAFFTEDLSVKSAETKKTANAVAVIKDLQEAFVRNWNMTPDDAKIALSAMFFGEAKARGSDPDSLWKDLPKPVQDVFEYGPEDLKRQQTITLAGSAITVAAIVGTGIAILASAPLAVVGALAGFGFVVAMIVNNLNDVFHWGPMMSDQNAEDMKVLLEGAETVGITSFGDFSVEDIEHLSNAFTAATIPGFRNPMTGELYEPTPAGVGQALNALITQLNAAFLVPTKPEVMALLKGWALSPTDRSGSSGIGAALELGIKPTPIPPEARAVVRITKKPKMFLGTIFSGRLAPLSVFRRSVDDEITSDADLLEDAETNLAGWLKHLPSKLTFEIQIKNNPFDEGNVKRPGTWATLALYITTRFGKRTFIDEVLLGPMDPAQYYPETARTLEISGTLPDFAKYADLSEREITQLLTAPGAYVPEAGVPAGPAKEAPPLPPEEEKPPKPTPKPYWQTEAERLEALGETDKAQWVRIYRPSGPGYESLMPKPAPPAEPPPPPAAPPPTAELTPELMVGNRPLFDYVVKKVYNRYYGGSPTQLYLDNLWKTGPSSWGAVVKSWNKEDWEIPPELLVAPTPEEEKPPEEGEVQTISRRAVEVNVDVLMVRAGPSTDWPLSGSVRLYRGEKFDVVGWTHGENVEGEDRWWKSWKGNWVWCGGTVEKPS